MMPRPVIARPGAPELRLQPIDHRLGAGNHKTRLTEQQVREIRRLHREGVGLREIARRYNVTHSPIRMIVHGRTWRWVSDPEIKLDHLQARLLVACGA
jgi:hypothetical protein